jgi:hypothetical protein
VVLTVSINYNSYGGTRMRTIDVTFDVALDMTWMDSSYRYFVSF